MSKKNIKLISKILALIMLISIWSTFAACAASGVASDNKYAGAIVESTLDRDFGLDFDSVESDSIAMAPGFTNAPSEAPTAPGNTSAETTEDYLNSQKLIYICNIELESLEFQETQNKIQELIEQNGGFVESNKLYDDAYGWYYSSYEKTTGTLRQELKVRIPSKNYNKFVNGITAVGKVQHKSENVQNITTQYNDTATTIKSLKAQEERLLDMMAVCNTIEDMITVERRLSDVQMQLEKYQTQLNRYDSDIKFSTVNITLEEVREYSPTYEEKNFFQRLAEHLDTTIEDFANFSEGVLFVVIYLFPYTVVITAIVLFVRSIILKIKAKKLAPTVKGMSVSKLETDKSKDVSVQTEVGTKKDKK